VPCTPTPGVTPKKTGALSTTLALHGCNEVVSQREPGKLAAVGTLPFVIAAEEHPVKALAVAAFSSSIPPASPGWGVSAAAAAAASLTSAYALQGSQTTSVEVMQVQLLPQVQSEHVQARFGQELPDIPRTPRAASSLDFNGDPATTGAHDSPVTGVSSLFASATAASLVMMATFFRGRNMACPAAH
jgi:hypothetical protein